MTYYIIAFRSTGEYEVVNTCGHIAYARKKINEMIDFNIQVWGYSEGFYICTEKAEKEYHGARITDNSRFCMKTIKGAKLKPYLAAAIADYIDEKKRYEEMLDYVNAERVAFPAP